MKLAKSHKIILTVVALALCLMLSLCTLSIFTGKAEEITSPSASNYFTADNGVIDTDGAKFSFDKNGSVEIKNKLAIDNMNIKFGAMENIKKLELVLVYDSFYVNGNKNEEGTFDKEITNKFEIDLTNFANEINVSVDENLDATTNLVKNQVIVNGEAKTDVYYKIRKVDKAVAKISFNVELNDGATSGSFVITDINQKAGDSAYNQSLKLVEDKLNPTLPVVSLNADMFVRNVNGKYENKVYKNEDYTLSYSVYSVIGNVSASDLYPTVGTGAKLTITNDNKNDNQDFIHVQTGADNASFNICYKDDTDVVIGTYTPSIVDENVANKAPEYLLDGNNASDKLAIEAFEAELEKQYYVLDDDGNFKLDENGKKQFVPLGTDVEIPSMEDFVIDDNTPYGKLTKKVYYASKEETSSSTFEIPLENVGEYYFYVVFTDSEDESMEVEDFAKFEDNGDVVYGKYGTSKADAKTNQKYIFYFAIKEDTEIVIKTPTKQGIGYKGTKYTASKFEITSSNCETVYKLEYATDKDSTEWVEIQKFNSEWGEDYVDENGYDYETLKAINYNGEYTFTPDKTGVYRITVDVTSKMSFKNSSASTIIEVNEPAKVITPASSSWIEDNVWSVVFLSVGTLCLVGIVVLLFVKPKDKKDEE